MFIKRGEGKIISIINDDDSNIIDENQKKAAKDTYNNIKNQSNKPNLKDNNKSGS